MVEGKLEQDTTYDKARISIMKSTKIYKKAGEKLIASQFKDLQVIPKPISMKGTRAKTISGIIHKIPE